MEKMIEREEEITVIICDDHPAYARGLGNLLSSEAPGFRVLGCATRGAEAVDMAAQLDPDVVLMDIRMPGMDGIEATRQIRSAAPRTKVVMLTVSDAEGDLYEAIRAGAAGFITKEKEVERIADAIRSVMQGDLVIPQELAGELLRELSDDDITTSLNDLEREILGRIVRGETNKEMAINLRLSNRTLSRRVEDLYQKLHITDRLQAALWAAKHGIGTAKEPQ